PGPEKRAARHKSDQCTGVARVPYEAIGPAADQLLSRLDRYVPRKPSTEQNNSPRPQRQTTDHGGERRPSSQVKGQSDASPPNEFQQCRRLRQIHSPKDLRGGPTVFHGS